MLHDLKQLVADTLKLDLNQITPDLSMQQVDSWDSLSHMHLITRIEQHYHVQLTMDDMIAMVRFDKIETILREKLQVQA